jgi:hypothetical protein
VLFKKNIYIQNKESALLCSTNNFAQKKRLGGTPSPLESLTDKGGSILPGQTLPLRARTAASVGYDPPWITASV